MRSLSLARLELRKMLTGRAIVAIAVAAILIVPLLYGALYLWAFWDPYSHVKDLPVALVNQDVAARSGDTTISAGSDLVGELKKKETMRWEVMTSDEASAALKDHRVYMALSIPGDFSRTLARADKAGATRAPLTVTVDEADSMLASQIGARVLAEVRAAASASASRGYFDAIWIGLADARSGMSDAASGAVKLSDGLVEAKGGSISLRDGLAQAKAGSATLDQGLSALKAGAASLAGGSQAANTGAATLASKLAAARGGATQLDGGVKQLTGGLSSLTTGLDTLAASGPQLTAASKQVAQGASQVKTGVASAMSQVGAAADASHQLAGGAAQVSGALQAYAAAHPEAAADPTFAAALAGSQQVAGGLSSLSDKMASASTGGAALAGGSAQLADGAAKLDVGLIAYATGVSEADAGVAQASAGARSVSVGSGALASGMATAASGAHDLAGGTSLVAAGSAKLASGAVTASAGSHDLLSGLGTLTSGAGTLASGIRSAASGSDELASGLTAGVTKLASGTSAQNDHKSDIMSDPVSLDTVKRTAVPNYGSGFAPYFIPLALWVGALVTFFLMKPINARTLLSGASDSVVALSGYWPAALIGSLQAIIMLMVVHYGLGLHMESPLLTYGLAILTALTFVALIQWLSFALGSAPGKLAAIVLLMLQLTSAAGTFPLETVPQFFKVVHPFLPMTYVVEGLRQTIAGGDLTVIVHCALALAAFLAIGLVGTLLAVHRQRVYTMDRLRPALTL